MESQVAMSHRRGFTLIELLVVISIIGVLATLIIANFNAARGRARDAQRKSDLLEIKTGLMMYHNDFGKFPENSDSKIAGCGTGGTTACNWGEKWEANIVYMKILPQDVLNDPAVPTSPSYQYQYITADDNFYLWATLENKGDSDINKTHTRCTDKGDYTYVVCAD